VDPNVEKPTEREQDPLRLLKRIAKKGRGAGEPEGIAAVATLFSHVAASQSVPPRCLKRGHMHTGQAVRDPRNGGKIGG
jgi:hypothetical protein